MSTLQSDLGDGWGEDGFEWPEWMESYDEPVVRASTKSGKRMHAPDPTADRPRAACASGNRDKDAFVGAERRNIEGFYVECENPECEQWFDDNGGSE